MGLEELILSCVNRITDRAVQAIALHCPHLTLLDLSCCFDLGDASCIAVSKGCPKLTHFFIAGCYNITNASRRRARALCVEMQEGCESEDDAIDAGESAGEGDGADAGDGGGGDDGDAPGLPVQ